MNRRLVKLLTAAVVCVAGLGFATVAWAYFTSSGTGTATASVATLVAPTGLAVTQPTAGTIHIAWSLPSQSSGITLTSVSVQRSNGTTTTLACSSPLAGTATACNDSGVAPGSYTYTVVSRFRSWSAQSAVSNSITVSSAVLTSIIISPASATIAAGGSRSYTATAFDQSGNSMGDVTSSTTFSIAPGGVCTAASCTAGAADAGGSHHTVTGSYSGKTAQASLTVTPGAASQLVFTPTTPGPATAGATISNVSVSVEDNMGNVETALNAGSVTISLRSGSPQSSFSSGITNVSVISGVGNFTNLVLNTAGSYVMTATPSSISGVTASVDSTAVTINAGPASKLSLAAATTTPMAAAANSLTITAKDTLGNTAASYTGSKSLTFNGASAIGTNRPTVSNATGTPTNFGSTTAISFSNGVASVTGDNNGVMTLYKAEAPTVIVTDGTINNGTGLNITVAPAAASTLTLAAASTAPSAGVADNLTITAKDAFGNVATGYTGDKSITFGGASTIGLNIPTVTNKTGGAINFGTGTTITFSVGVATVSASSNGVMKLYKAEAANIIATDSTISNGTGLAITVAATAASKFQLVGPAASITAGTAFNLTSLTALDTFGNAATTYAGTKTIDWSSASASPSAATPTYPTSSVSFDASGAATTALTATLVAAGSNTMTATEHGTTTTGSLSASVLPGTAARLAWTSVTVDAGTLSSPCLFACTDIGIGNNSNFAANVSVTDSLGNIVSNLGSGHTVSVSTPATGNGSGGAFTTPAAGTSISLTIATSGPATSITRFTFKSQNGSWTSDTFATATTAGASYTGASATVTKP